MSEQWGPWIEHDGTGCPCVGEFVESVRFSGEIKHGIAGTIEGGGTYDPNLVVSPWVWDECPIVHMADIKRYRIRKPRAMKRLNEILREVEDRPKVGA